MDHYLEWKCQYESYCLKCTLPPSFAKPSIKNSAGFSAQQTQNPQDFQRLTPLTRYPVGFLQSNFHDEYYKSSLSSNILAVKSFTIIILNVSTTITQNGGRQY